jgi:hypothetical protein
MGIPPTEASARLALKPQGQVVGEKGAIRMKDLLLRGKPISPGYAR